MKLINKIILRISLVLVVLLTIWATFFYYTIMDEISDETDDALENYSEMLITRHLAGYPLPPEVNGYNNTYFIREIDEKYAKGNKGIEYRDEMIDIPEKQEEEPARILKTIFRDKDDNYFELTVSTPTIEKDDLIEAILQWIIILYIGLLLTIILVNVYVFHQSLKPLYRLLKWLDSYKIGQKNVELKNDTSVTEFRKLNEAMLRHVGRTEVVFEQQKQFIGNASHEIQTPLAVCDNRLEWLIDNTDLNEDQLKEVLKTKQTLNYLVKLNKSLLFISKIDNGQFFESTDVDINALVKQQIELCEEVYASRGIVISLDERSSLLVSMNDVLGISLITNLIKNACVHNVEGGSVNIEINQTGITVSNTSQVAALNKKQIFERFYQGNKKVGSTGLGLSIVQSICKLYDMKIDYDYHSNRHHFQVRMK